jgi:hypothetical protein
MQPTVDAYSAWSILAEVVLVVGYATTGEELPMATGTLLEVAAEMMGTAREHAAVAATTTSGRGAAVAGLAAVGNVIEQPADQLEWD